MCFLLSKQIPGCSLSWSESEETLVKVVNQGDTYLYFCTWQWQQCLHDETDQTAACQSGRPSHNQARGGAWNDHMTTITITYRDTYNCTCMILRQILQIWLTIMYMTCYSLDRYTYMYVHILTVLYMCTKQHHARTLGSRSISKIPYNLATWNTIRRKYYH